MRFFLKYRVPQGNFFDLIEFLEMSFSRISPRDSSFSSELSSFSKICVAVWGISLSRTTETHSSYSFINSFVLPPHFPLNLGFWKLKTRDDNVVICGAEVFFYNGAEVCAFTFPCNIGTLQWIDSSSNNQQ